MFCTLFHKIKLEGLSSDYGLEYAVGTLSWSFARTWQGKNHSALSCDGEALLIPLFYQCKQKDVK